MGRGDGQALNPTLVSHSVSPLAFMHLTKDLAPYDVAHFFASLSTALKKFLSWLVIASTQKQPELAQRSVEPFSARLYPPPELGSSILVW